MTITDLALADFCARLYDPAQAHGFTHLFADGECYAAVAYVDGASVLVFRGSSNLLDWYNDLDTTPIIDPQLGAVHGGFFRGVRDWHERIVGTLAGDIYVTGHSLGAARAFLSAGLMLANGIVPRAVVGFGCPRPGESHLSQIIAAHPSARWYRNRHDPVTYVPFRLGEFVHAGEMRVVDAAGSFPDPWLFLADHHLELYRAGLEKLNVAA